MIDRYTPAPMKALWSDQARLDRWLKVEILATEAWAELGVVPKEHAALVRERAAFTVEAVDARELITDHDVAAFVDVVQESVGMPAGGWVHYGLTSADVGDTAICVAMVEACDLILGVARQLRATLAIRAIEFADTPCMGRTHGIHAEPTTFGTKLALWAQAIDRDIERLNAARVRIAVGKLSGAVGTYSNIDPSVEAYVCEKLGLTPVPATQVIARDRHAEVLYACASIGATVETIALEVRHLQRTEVREVREPFRVGQKGSSAMPHKRNPITAERICGLARILRGNLVAALEDVALWHERDISHSSVERVILPDSTTLAYYVIVRTNSMMAGLFVDTKRMLENIDSSFGLVFSQPVMLALIEAGRSRDEAYRIVQDRAMEAWETGQQFRELIEGDDRAALSKETLDLAFSLQRSLRHAHRVIDAVKPFVTLV